MNTLYICDEESGHALGAACMCWRSCFRCVKGCVKDCGSPDGCLSAGHAALQGPRCLLWPGIIRVRHCAMLSVLPTLLHHFEICKTELSCI